MDRERARELLPIIQAFAEGKTIQLRYKGERTEWDDGGQDLEFNCFHDYRIKPEPRELWVEPRKMLIAKYMRDPGPEWIKVREVLDD